MDKTNLPDHRARYKNSALDAKELRRRREEDSVQLRRQKREDVLSKRRTVATEPDPYSQDDLPIDEESFESRDPDFTITQAVVDALKQDTDQQLLIDSTQKVRKILSKEPQPPFDEVIQKGLIPRFVELLDSSHPMIQFEVAWILTNVCSGTTEQTRAVVNAGAVPKLIRLLHSQDMKVCEQAVWALGNIIGDGADFRDLVISHDFVPALLSLIRPNLDLGFLRNETWVIVNLCRNKDPPPSLDVIKQLIPALGYLIQSSDLAVLIDTTWAVSYITELGPIFSQLIIDSGIVVQMTSLLSHKEIKIQTAAIRALGSIVTGNDEQTQAVIDAGALPHLARLLKENKDKIVKEALWFVSNITAGSTNQIQAIIDNQLIPSIIYHLGKGDFAQQKEASWIIYNMSLSATPKQLQVLIQENAIEPLCELMKLKDPGTIRNALESLTYILKACHSTNPEVCDVIEACGGLDKLEEMQSNESYELYTLSYKLIEEYFNDPAPE